MAWRRVRKPMKVFTQGASLRRRVAYSFALVRLILVPVIFLAIYYLFAMGWIVDRIVNVDAPVATLAERASIEMGNARRAAQNYFLLHDRQYVEASRESLSNLDQIIATCRELQPEEAPAIDEMQVRVNLYRQRFEKAVSGTGDATQVPLERIRKVVRAYQQDLNDLLRRSSRQSRREIIDELRNKLGSFDTDVATVLEAEDPELHQTTQDLANNGNAFQKLANDLEQRSWARVTRDHQEARGLIRRAEWVLCIVSALTIVLSVWVSIVLPRQVVKPLADLKEAVDHAAAGNYEIEFEVQGEGEVVQLANSVRELIAHVREKKTNNGATPAP
ncbi:MAG TPA: HAMP domain-containing protein [Terriglobia bacterium]|jgi:methyl-accepting chemotaxis protein|nr:HAMP domain-containing protein [Terriglobia bacterium]